MLDALKSRLVADWLDCHKWWSVRWNALGAVVLPLLTAVPSMPADIQGMLPEWLRAAVAGAWCGIAIYFRVYAQKSPDA